MDQQDRTVPEDRRSGDDRRRRGWLSARKGSEKVPCPDCGHPFSCVYDGEGVRRFRECAECGTRYATTEVFERRLA